MKNTTEHDTLSISTGTQFCHAADSSADERKSSWIQYWRNYSGNSKKNIKYSSQYCNNAANVGWHVYFHSLDSMVGHYLCFIPICKPCYNTK